MCRKGSSTQRREVDQGLEVIQKLSFSSALLGGNEVSRIFFEPGDVNKKPTYKDWSYNMARLLRPIEINMSLYSI